MKELNNVEIYGSQIKPITFDDRFNIIKTIHKFKRATIYGSAISNELFLIDDTNKGIYDAYRGWMICNAEPVYGIDITGQPTSRIESYKVNQITSLEEYCSNHQQEVIEWFDSHIDTGKYFVALAEKEKFNKDNPNYYYELDFSEPKQFEVYIEDKVNTKGYISVEGNENCLNIETDNVSLGTPDESILQSVIRYIFSNRNLFNGFKKLDNGYIFNNKYYEEIDDIFSDIEWKIQHNSKLNDKFMNDGLSLEDLKEDKQNG